MRLRSNLSADAALVLTTLFWGTTFVLAKDVLAQWSTVSYLAGRFALAALTLVVLFWKQVARARREELKVGAVLGVLLAIGFVLQAQGQIYTTPAKSAFVTGLTTPIVPFIAFIVLRVRPNVENLIGVALASIGGALILAPQDASGAISFSRGEINTGDVLTLISNFAFAAHVVFLSIYARRFDARQLTALQITTAAVVFCLAWLILPTAPLVWEARIVWQLIYLALVATVLTFLLWTWGQARMSATHAAIIFSLEPVFATVFAILWRGRSEWLGTRGGIGAGLVLCGVIVSEIKFRAAKKDEARLIEADDEALIEV
jgi:drug/metabolite transporter (DMT)-like permease